jgi:hypothetical protein
MWHHCFESSQGILGTNKADLSIGDFLLKRHRLWWTDRVKRMLSTAARAWKEHFFS